MQSGGNFVQASLYYLTLYCIDYRCPLGPSVGVNVGGLVQERRNSSALSMELRLSCTSPLICGICRMAPQFVAKPSTLVTFSLTWNNARLLSTGPWESSVGFFLHSKKSSALWRPFCSGLNELTHNSSLWSIDLHKIHNATVSYPTMHHSEQKCAHFCSEWCIVRYGTDAV